jgi:protein O-mannosyl-transferase
VTQRKKPTRKEKIRKQTSARATDSHPSNQFSFLPGLIIALTGFILYANTLNHGYTLDDYSIILENRVTKQGWSAIGEIFTTSYRHGYYFTDDNLYRPIVKSMFAIEWGASPNNPTPGHWMNVLLYALTGWILFQTLLKLSGNRLFFSFAASLLFVAHPVHTEVVASIKSRDEIMAFLFCILSLQQFMRWLSSENKTALILACLFYLIALLSKETAITFVAIFPLAGWMITPEKSPVQLLKKSVPVLSVALIFLALRTLVIGDQVPDSVSVADNLLVAAQNGFTRMATAFMILGLYLKILIFPHPLVFDYSYNQIPLVTFSDWRSILSLVIYVSSFVWAVWKWKSYPIPAFGILFYLITISISSNLIITIGSSMGERFLYMPSLGFCIVAGYLISLIPGSTIQEEGRTSTLVKLIARHKTGMGLLLLIVSGYSYKTIARNPVWKNNYTLYSNDVHLSPNSTRTHYYLGNYLIKPEAHEGMTEEEKNATIRKGINSLKRSISIYDRFSDAHLQLGVAYYKLNMYDSALVAYQKALEINPKYASTHNNIGTLYFVKGQHRESLKYFLEAIRLDPRYSEAYANAGSAYGMLQLYDEALNHLFNAVKYDPNYAQAWYFIGLTYRFKGDEKNANIYLEKAYQLNPKLRPQ